MSLFSKKKQTDKTFPQKNKDEPKASLDKTNPAVRPGGVFLVHLLMKEPCEMPSQNQMQEVLTKHIGRVEAIGSSKVSATFAALDYAAHFKDGDVPVQLSVGTCDTFQADKIDDVTRSQMWDCMADRDRILSQCQAAILAYDMLGGGLKPQVRANMLMDYLEALLELYPSCEAVYFLTSGKLILADTIRAKKVTGLDRFIQYVVNVRFFNISGTDDHVIDTLGLSLLYIEDLQYHFHDMDPNWVVGHAYSTASYLLGNDRPIQDGDTIAGIMDGQMAEEIYWKCHFEDALIQPKRPVLDIYMNEYAAGGR